MLRRWTMLLACLFVTLSAFGQATRTWVSGVGDDVNPCSRTAPCKTFAGAISKTAAGGEIDALDPGGFGAVTITKSMTIDGAGAGLAGVLASGSQGIIVNALSTDVVTLRNLSISGVSNATNGVKVFVAKSVHIENCQIFGYQRGVDFEPSNAGAVLEIRDSVIRNNDPTNLVGGGGVLVKSVSAVAVQVSLENVRMDRNNFGFRVEDGGKAIVRNSAATSSQNSGFVVVSAGSAAAQLNLDSTTSSNNGTNGVFANAPGGTLATARLSNAFITGNTTGLATAGGGNAQIISHLNNWFQGNGVDGAPTSTLAGQ